MSYELCSFVHTVFLYPDDEESAFRRRPFASQECDPAKGYICQAATIYFGLFEYIRLKSNVSR